jgi:hypothetical protein
VVTNEDLGWWLDVPPCNTRAGRARTSLASRIAPHDPLFSAMTTDTNPLLANAFAHQPRAPLRRSRLHGLVGLSHYPTIKPASS